jgi:hypothetical protein
MGVADVGPWDLGWEFVLAIVTLLLALVTAGLAWTTRRLARATSDEVQGQTRPVVVPTEDPIHVGVEQPYPDQEGKPRYPEPGAVYGEARGSFDVTVRLRNIGVGPALNLEGEVARDRYPGNRITALPPGEDAEIGIHITLYNEGAHPFFGRISPLTVNYFDLAGRQFTTSFSWTFLGFEQDASITAYLAISSGEVPERRQRPLIGPDDFTNPFRQAQGRFWPSRWAVRNAWTTHIVQAPDEVPHAFHLRLHSAWRGLFPKRLPQRFQRMAWSIRVYKATVEKPIPSRIGRLLPIPYRILRGMKWATLTYFRMR